MKKLSVLLFVLFFFSCFNVFGQLLVFDSLLQETMKGSFAEQMIKYAQMLEKAADQYGQMLLMAGYLQKQVTASAQNWNSLQNVKSWDDFMDFYNRQMYLERKSLDTFENMKVNVGDKSYHMLEVHKILDGIGEHSHKYWTSEFTEAQRKEMWTALGLTPSNYVYSKSLREKARNFAKESLTMREVQNESYMADMQDSKKRRDRFIEDRNLPQDAKMGEKEVLIYIGETLLDSNKVLNDIAMQNAAMMEFQGVQYFLDETPHDRPVLSEWPGDGFESLN